MSQVSFDYQLQRHLWKAELEFRAAHQSEACCLEWLAPYCGSLEEVYEFLRSLGYRKLTAMTDSDADGLLQWVEASGFSVFVNTNGVRGLFSPQRS